MEELGLMQYHLICRPWKDETSEKTDAIAIQYYSKLNRQRATYYYPYVIADKNKVHFGEPWGREGH